MLTDNVDVDGGIDDTLSRVSRYTGVVASVLASRSVEDQFAALLVDVSGKRDDSPACSQLHPADPGWSLRLRVTLHLTQLIHLQLSIFGHRLELEAFCTQ